uniref:Uncharacterized 12.7 kDa protein in 16S rRNA region n=1 Tax=Chlamydomonas reinhardtii TaxID=3055 RepID=YCX2_CHLRE|nr:RecName: Full=Uncharacterized 12.7 kDa protein in 16S rRNA region [Chlamydomonas reinhardtii]CAA27023.1 hypothetical protein [Chlamydomonas reinhardtii]
MYWSLTACSAVLFCLRDSLIFLADDVNPERGNEGVAVGTGGIPGRGIPPLITANGIGLYTFTSIGLLVPFTLGLKTQNQQIKIVVKSKISETNKLVIFCCLKHIISRKARSWLNDSR